MKTRSFLLLGVLCALLFALAAEKSSAADRRSGDVGGTVTAADRPVGDALVVIEGKTRTGRDYVARTRSDRAGRYFFEGVPAGQYVVRGAKRGVGQDRKRVHVMPTETYRVPLELH